jgi:L-rhamnose isomerase
MEIEWESLLEQDRRVHEAELVDDYEPLERQLARRGMAMARRARGGAINPMMVYRDSRYREQVAKDRPADVRRGGGIV